VCVSLCTTVVHNAAQNSYDNFPSYPSDSHHNVYWKDRRNCCIGTGTLFQSSTIPKVSVRVRVRFRVKVSRSKVSRVSFRVSRVRIRMRILVRVSGSSEYRTFGVADPNGCMITALCCVMWTQCAVVAVKSSVPVYRSLVEMVGRSNPELSHSWQWPACICMARLFMRRRARNEARKRDCARGVRACVRAVTSLIAGGPLWHLLTGPC